MMDLRRSALAALAGVVAAGLSGAPLSGYRASFTLMLPLLVLFGASLLRRAEDQELGAKVLVLLTMAASLNLWVSQLLISLDGQTYIPPGAELRYTLSAAASSPRAAGPMLLGAGVAGAVLVGRRAGALVGAALGGALGARIGRMSLQAGSGELVARNMQGLEHDADVAVAVGLLAVAFAALGWTAQERRGGRGAWLSLGGTLLAVVVSTPPLPLLLDALPSPATEAAVPVVAPGVPLMRAPLSLEEPGLSEDLRAMGQRRVYREEWLCMTSDPGRWTWQLRAAAAVDLPEQASVERLRPALPTLSAYGVTRLSFTARAPDASGVLAPALGWPGASIILERPPENARWVEITEDGWRWMGPAPPVAAAGICAAWAEEGLSAGALRRALLELDGGARSPCPGGVALTWLWVEPGAERPALGCSSG
ncbi:MAG: hypothetical protein H6741_22820 [Alphaproteobacteria bacterium]|nr:hypothetical protein [Alphaproteobacteria bacterium]